MVRRDTGTPTQDLIILRKCCGSDPRTESTRSTHSNDDNGVPDRQNLGLPSQQTVLEIVSPRCKRAMGYGLGESVHHKEPGFRPGVNVRKDSIPGDRYESRQQLVHTSSSKEL